MITAVVGVSTYLESELALDTNGDPVSGLVWSIAARLLGTETTTEVSIDEDGDSAGDYLLSGTFPSIGVWTVRYSTTIDGQLVRFRQTVQVIPASADPAALATAVAAVQTTVDTIDGNVDVAVSTRATPGAYVTTGSVVSTDGDIEVRRGNAYLATDSRALPWATTSASQWPTLTSATITLRAESKYDDRVTFTASGSVVTATGATKAVQVELSEAQTTSLTAGDWLYELHAVLSNGSDVELASGAMTVLESLS